MSLTTISVIVTIVAGAISIIQGLLGIIGRLRGKNPTPSPQPTSPGGAPPAPAPGYGVAPTQGYAPAPVQTAQQERPARRFGTHPWIALGVGAGYLLYAIAAAFGGANSTGGQAILTLGVLLIIAVWIVAVVRVILLQRWGWLIALILGTAVTAFVFGIIGPVERRA